jgi:hypothetical protein
MDYQKAAWPFSRDFPKGFTCYICTTFGLDLQVTPAVSVSLVVSLMSSFRYADAVWCYRLRLLTKQPIVLQGSAWE